MHAPPQEHQTNAVALRKESVDRNIKDDVSYSIIVKSLSARRAWIEIKSGLHPLMASLVALRKESVDRNFYYSDKDADWVRRSPQGERG